MYESLKKTAEFSQCYQNGKSYANRYLVMYRMENQSSGNRIGISVSKRVGNSVVRHRIKRLIRESSRLNAGRVKTGYDIVVVARVNAKDRSFAEIESAYLHLIGLHGLFQGTD